MITFPYVPPPGMPEPLLVHRILEISVRKNDFIQAIMDFSNVRHSAALDTGSRPNRAIVNLHVTTRHVLRDHLTA